MMRYSVFSVISPEGCAAILWNDPKKQEQATKAMKITAEDLKELGLIDDVIEEPLIGAHRQKKDAIEAMTVTTSTGKTFYADPQSRLDISDAILAGTSAGIESTMWKLAVPFDGEKIVEVTLDELKEAQMMALREKAKIVGVPE